MENIPIAIAEGDGIGPEIMSAVVNILNAAECPLEYKKVEIGEKLYLKNFKAGIDPKTWDIIRNSRAFLKAPITTPQGGGFKSLNVTVRTSLGLYANVRPCISYSPYVKTKHPKMDVVIVRENEEDLYCGIEYRQSLGGFEALKIITRDACEKIIRFAFDYAVSNNRKKVTCFTKDNILKLTDGEFHKVFDEIAKEYPEIENEHWIVDIGAAKLADTPEAFDVIVMPNLYGDILSDVAAQIAGSVGLAGSANIGELGAMFEAIHGSAPRRAGQNLANPSGLLLAAVMMLNYIGLPEKAALIHNAWVKTLEDGIHTYDIYEEGKSTKKVGTKEFGEAIIERLGQKPEKLKRVEYKKSTKKPVKKEKSQKKEKKELVGCDIFIDLEGKELSHLLEKIEVISDLKLAYVFNRGVKVWPEAMPETSLTSVFRFRFYKKDLNFDDIISLQKKLNTHAEIVKIENLYTFEGKPGYSLSSDEQ